MMTRQDFNLLERIIRDRVRRNERRELFPCQQATKQELVSLVSELGNALEQRYSSFNKGKFMKGCGL